MPTIEVSESTVRHRAGTPHQQQNRVGVCQKELE